MSVPYVENGRTSTMVELIGRGGGRGEGAVHDCAISRLGEPTHGSGMVGSDNSPRKGTRMTSSINRRGFLGGAAATGLGIAITGSIDVLAGSGSALAAPRSSDGYGPLVPDPKGLLSLPAGFSYRIVTQSGVTPTADGVPTASDPDGSGVFARGTGSTIVNNHEIGGSEPFPVPPLAGLTYDEGASGGTSNIEVDADGTRVREYASVAGTHNNC